MHALKQAAFKVVNLVSQSVASMRALTIIRQTKRYARNGGKQFHDLPVEILLCIFLSVAKIDGCGKCRTTPLLRGAECSCRLPPQYLVSTVCRRWRSVATQYACLWTTLQLSNAMPAEFLQRVAAQSATDDREVATPRTRGSMALTVHLRLNLRSSDVASPNSLDVLIQLVAAEHRRLRELHIVASSPEPLTAFVDAVGVLAMPRLETLEIIYQPINSGRNPEDRPLFVAFDVFDGRAPSLRRVELRECGLPMSKIARLRSLREFSSVVGPFTPNDLHALSVAASGLTHLTLVGQPAKRDDFTLSSLRFPVLQSLRLCGAASLCAVLQHLDAPALSKFQIEDWRIDDIEMLDQCIEAITSPTSGSTKLPQLRWLGLEVHVGNTPPHVALGRLSRFVVAFPTLEHFTFSGPQVSAFLNELSLRHMSGSSTLLPALESVNLFGAHDQGFLREVAAFVKRRKVAGHALREVGLSVLVTMSTHLLPLALCRILKMYSRGANITGVIYPDDETWMHSTYEREEQMTTEYLHAQGELHRTVRRRSKFAFKFMSSCIYN